MKYATSLSLTRGLKALAGVAALCFAAQAQASLISIGLQTAGVNGGAITTVATDGGIGAVMYGGVGSTFGYFNINQISATGAPILAQGNLATTSVNVNSSNAATITVYITEQGLTAPVGSTNFLSAFTQNNFFGNVLSVVESTLYSSTNQLYAGTQMGTATFTTPGPTTATSNYNVGTSGLYSETAVYVVTVGSGGGTANDTINITAAAAATPEPSSLMMLGTGLMSAAGMMIRRRKIS